MEVQCWSDNQEKLSLTELQSMECLAQKIGLTFANAHLYMQGHCVYDLLIRIGRALCHNKHDFQTEVLEKTLILEGYPEATALLKAIAAGVAH